MTGRVTPLGLSLLTVIMWALSLAVLSARPELFVAALPLMMTLATLVRSATSPDYSLTHQLSADRIFEGEALTVTITVTAKSARPFLELLEPLSPGHDLVSGSNRAVMALRPGQTASVRYEIRCAGRGVRDFGTMVVRCRDRWGIRAWERHHADRKPVRVYPRTTPLRSLPRPRHTQTSIGDYVSRAFGEGIEPGDIRQFAPGDRIRQVNWRASLRLGTLYVTQHHRERNADVVLMLDTLAQAGAPPDTTLDFTVRAAASLATAYLARKDRVGLVIYGGMVDWVRPGSGRGQDERPARLVVRAEGGLTDVCERLRS